MSTSHTYILQTPSSATSATAVSYWTSVPSIINSHFADIDFAMHPNWDGKGAVAIQSDVLALADRIACRYASVSHLVEVSPGLDGSVSLLWDDENGNYVYLSVGPNDTIHLYYDVVGLSKWEGVGRESDPAISRELSRAFRFLHPIPQVSMIPIHAHTSTRDRSIAA